MLFFLTGCVVGAAVALCVAAPLLMPWPLRVRYLVHAQMIDDEGSGVQVCGPDADLADFRLVREDAPS